MQELLGDGLVASDPVKLIGMERIQIINGVLSPEISFVYSFLLSRAFVWDVVCANSTCVAPGLLGFAAQEKT